MHAGEEKVEWQKSVSRHSSAGVMPKQRQQDLDAEKKLPQTADSVKPGK